MERMHEMMGLVRENMHKAQQSQKQHYDWGGHEWKTEVGGEVLVLLLDPRNHLKFE